MVKFQTEGQAMYQPTTYEDHREKLLTELLAEVRHLRSMLAKYEDPAKIVLSYEPTCKVEKTVYDPACVVDHPVHFADENSLDKCKARLSEPPTNFRGFFKGL
jgi:hypothetical protein